MKKKGWTIKGVANAKLFFTIALGTVLITVNNTVNAQVQVPTTKGATVNAGSLLTQFTNAIKPSSFTEGWTKEKSNCTK